MKYDLVIVGGGAAGVFCAIQAAERNPDLKILILEKSKELLSKVRISGGGRCNVTHACFDPVELTGFYPRGQKELLGPFHTFMCGDMTAWLSDRGVETKIEEDGRIFPSSNSSETIINCFLNLCRQYNIPIYTQSGVDKIIHEKGQWKLFSGDKQYVTANILFATGSSPAAWKILRSLGHTIAEPVPSLFTFNIQNPLLNGLAGISVPSAVVTVKDTKFSESGPLLITHWGLSGPAILKLSAWAARELNDKKYRFDIEVNWIGHDAAQITDEIQNMRKTHGSKKLHSNPLFGVPKRLWQKMISILLPAEINFADLSANQISDLTQMLGSCRLSVTGKSTYKDEFVTCGGIDTKEINFKTMESRLHPGLYFAGEVINIDAVTGGFNFQAAWTGAYLAATAIAQNPE